jgi:hypothetical protein
MGGMEVEKEVRCIWQALPLLCTQRGNNNNIDCQQRVGVHREYTEARNFGSEMSTILSVTSHPLIYNGRL